MAKETFTNIICGREMPTASKGRMTRWIYRGARMQNIPADDGTAPQPPYTFEGGRFKAMVYRGTDGHYLWGAPNSEVIRIFEGDKVRA